MQNPSTEMPPPLRFHRLGLMLLAAFLVAGAVVVGLSLQQQQADAHQQAQQRGVMLARVLSAMPVSAAPSALTPIKQIFEFQARDAQFAYGAVLDKQGQVIFTTKAPAAVDNTTLQGINSWMLQRQVTGADGEPINEFIGPLGNAPADQRYYQVGYYEPGLPLGANASTALACLPLLLLTLFCWWLVRRELSPLAKISEQLHQFQASKQLEALPLERSGETSQFVFQFNDFVDYAQQRIESSNAISSKLITNERFLNYRMARLTNVLEALPDGLVWLDEQGKLLAANQRAQTIFGLTADEMQNTALASWSEETNIHNFLSKLAQAGPKLIDPVLVDLPAPAPACLQLSAFPVRQPGSQSKIIGTVVLLRDATSESLAKRSRSEFIANVAHELKSPLNTLGLYTDSLIDEGDDPEIRREAVGVIQDEVDRLARLINNLLNITQIEMGNLQLQKQRTRLDSLVRDTFETIKRGEAAKALDMQLHMPDELPTVTVDKDLLRIAINNLLTNAVKYSDPGDEVKITVLDTADTITIEVSDSGIGIDPAEQEQIFNKFYRAQDANASQRGGHGLGLALSKEIVQLHHGTLRLESTLGEGSTFALDLWKSTGLVQEAI